MPKEKKLQEEKKDSEQSNVLFAFKVIEGLLDCPISLEIMKKPQLTTCCGQAFDLSSFITVGIPQQCPLCKRTFGYVIDRHLASLIDNLSVFKTILQKSEEKSEALVECKNENAKLARALQDSQKENAELASDLQDSQNEINELTETNIFLFEQARISLSKQEQEIQAESKQAKQRKWWQHPVIALTTSFIAGGAVSHLLLSWSRMLQLTQSSSVLINAIPPTNSSHTGIVNSTLLQELAPSVSVSPPVSPLLFCYANESAIQEFNHMSLLSGTDTSTASTENTWQQISIADIQPVAAENDLRPAQDNHAVNQLPVVDDSEKVSQDVLKQCDKDALVSTKNTEELTSVERKKSNNQTPKTSTENNGIIKSHSDKLLFPLRFKNSPPSYDLFEEDKANAQYMFEQLYSRNRMFKCKLDALSKGARFHIQFVQQKGTGFHGIAEFKLEEAEKMSLSLSRNVTKNIKTQRDILCEIESAFVANDNFKLRRSLDFPTRPIEDNQKEIDAYSIAIKSDLKNINKYFSLAKKTATLSDNEKIKLDKLALIAEGYEPFIFERDTVEEKQVTNELAKGYLDKNLRYVTWDVVRTATSDQVYSHHIELKNGKYIRYISPSPPGVSKVQTLLYDASFLFEAILRVKTTKLAQVFGVYPGLVEILFPALTEYEINHRSPSYKACLDEGGDSTVVWDKELNLVPRL